MEAVRAAKDNGRALRMIGYEPMEAYNSSISPPTSEVYLYPPQASPLGIYGSEG